MKLASLLFVLAFCAPSLAQYPSTIYSTEQRIGNFTYVDQGGVSAVYHRIGGYEYGYYSNGATDVRRKIGGRVYSEYTPPKSYYRPAPTYQYYKPAFRRGN